ncbi:MBL fold metallo-hydrolase [Endozoicomonas ascidiicola]|uniref:MBL fold metallo-hydrolase n=1 Tax=Endozoicomonas ascidiicola TaxID=1698521 RepID=UPI000835816D|nr:MBL fold metallo-hydrolase [Endozoicomonas ascidiicola]
MSLFERVNYQGVEGIRCRRKNSVNTSFITYRIGDTIIDTAPANQWQFVKPFFQEQPIRQILLTHHHEDHSGNAARLKALSGITPMGSQGTCLIMEKGFPFH